MLRKRWIGAIVVLGLAASGAVAPSAQAALVAQDSAGDVCLRYNVLEYPVRICVVD